MSKPSTIAKTSDNRYKILLFVAALSFFIDQVTKWIIVAILPLYKHIVVIPGFFDIVHIQNRGAAFGFLNSHDIQWQFWLFALATLIAMFLIYSISKSSLYNKNLFICLGLIVGGALGNFLDRIRFQAVTDFLDFYLGTWHWPAFNVADVAISLGAIGAAFLLYLVPSTQSKKHNLK